jgi:hypothetical protein
MTMLLSPTANLPGHTVKSAVLAVCLLLTLVASLFFAAGGHISVDEGVYHMMAQSFSSAGSLSVWNGYEEFPSPELTLPMLRAHGGQLFPQYPPFATVLAAPLYRLAGYQGLYILNAVSFIGTVGLSLLIARALFRDLGLALNACLILILATYAWQYSQVAWPHALSMLFVMGAVYCAVASFQASGKHNSLLLAMAAGLVAGFGTGVRLDVSFVLPALLLPLAFMTPWRPWHALAVCIGTAPGLAVLAVANSIKFGVVSPFSYGLAGSGAASSLLPYLPVMFVGLAATATLWTATRPWGRSWLASHRLGAGLGAALLLIALGLTPVGWQMVSRLANGAYLLLVDLRIRDLGIAEGGLSRGPSGSMIYLGGLKKALLQSCPYLIVLVLPLAVLARGRKDGFALGLLFLVPAVYVAAFSYFAWHGGQAFNLRYFVPILPFTSILTAYAWREATRDLSHRWRRAAFAAGLSTIVLYLFLAARREPTLAQQESIVLTMPLVIALAISALLMARRLGGGKLWTSLQGMTGVALAIGLAWAGVVALTYDAPRAHLWRKQRADFARNLAPHIESDSILFVPNGDRFYSLLEGRRLRLATPDYDNYRDFRALVDFHLEAGRPVYLWLDRILAQAIEERNLLDSLTTVTLYKHWMGSLVQVREPAAEGAKRAPRG